MAVSWEIDLYFDADRKPITDPDDELAETEQMKRTKRFGRDVYKVTVECDSFEHGSSGTVALYYEDKENGLMERSHSIKDPGLVGVDATRVGEPDTPDPDEIAETEDEWDQGAA